MSVDIESVNVMSLKPGDALLVRVQGILSSEVLDRVRRHVEARVPGYPVLVVDDTVPEVSIVRREEVAA